MTRAWPESDIHNRGDVISGVARFLSSLKMIDNPLGIKSILARLGKKPLEGIFKRGQSLREIHGTCMADAIRMAMAEQYNKGLGLPRRIPLMAA